MSVYKDEKRGTWYFSIRIKDENGFVKQVVRRGFKTETQAKKAEKQVYLNDKPSAIKKNVTFRQVVEECKERDINKITPNVINRNKVFYEKYIDPYFKDIKISNLTPKFVESWNDYMLSTYDGQLKVSTLNVVQILLKKYLNYMQKYENTPNYSVYLEKFTRNTLVETFESYDDVEEDFNIYTLNEFEQFISVFSSDDWLYKNIFITLFNTGLRINELRALQVADIDFENKKLRINKSLTLDNVSGVETITRPKTKSSIRVIDIDNRTIEVLTETVEHFKRYRDFKDTWFVFGGLIPTPIYTIRYRNKQYANKANMKEIKLHDFRHSHASYLVSNGFNVLFVSSRLGHSSPTMTLKVYSHSAEEYNKKEMNKLNELIQEHLKD